MCAWFLVDGKYACAKVRNARDRHITASFTVHIYEYVLVFGFLCLFYPYRRWNSDSSSHYLSLSHYPEYKRLISNVSIHLDLWMRSIYPNNLTISWNDNIAMISTWHVQDRLQTYMRENENGMDTRVEQCRLFSLVMIRLYASLRLFTIV